MHAAPGLEIAEVDGFRVWVPLARMFLALCDAAAGELEEGLGRAFAEFERFAATGHVNTQCQIHAVFGELLIAPGRPEEAVQRIGPRIEAAQLRGEHQYLSELHRVRGEALRAAGDQDLARADFARAAEVARAQGAGLLLRRADASAGGTA